MTTTESPITSVSDTALWVATYRAMESERKDALFRDPYARRLAGERGEAIVRAMPEGRRLAWPMVVRTCLLDEMITRLVGGQGAEAVLNLAAGLDARPWRMPLPPTLHWYDVDLPGILDYKRTVLGSEKPACALESRAVDLRDAGARRELFAEVGAAHRRVVVMSEGLLIYLEAEEVAGLARDLAAVPGFHWWLIDLASPRLLQFTARKWSSRLSAGNAPMKFAPPEGTAFFRPHGWAEGEFRSIFHESVRLKRSIPMAGLWSFLARFAPPARREQWRRFSGVVRLDRASP